MTLPSGLSGKYWSTWSPARRGISVVESLAVDRDDGEEWIGSWDGVGLYEGNVNKVPGYQMLSVHLTTHRLILLPDPTISNDVASSSSSSSSPMSPALQTHLSFIRQTEFYTGFMRSSAKITLFFGLPPSSSSPTVSATTNVQSSSSWTCRVCGYVNTSSASFGQATGANGFKSKCGLCGVAYAQGQSSHPPSRTNTPSPANPDLASGTSSQLHTSTSLPVVTKQESGTSEIACPACTFLNSPFLPNCEICSTPLPSSKQRSLATQNGPIVGGSASDTGEEGKPDIVRLSFRKGGEKEAYKKLKSVLSGRSWEKPSTIAKKLHNNLSSSSTADEGLSQSRSGAGIDGILQSIDLSAKAQDEHMRTAFQDLEVLMLRAGEMVRLAQSLNSKLTTQQANGSSAESGATEEEASMIRTSLVQLGLAAPALTQDMVRNEKAYHEGLAKELGALLTGRKGDAYTRADRERLEGLMVGSQGRGVIGLDEVWGLWMRARGVALLPPSTLIDILTYLPAHTSPAIQSLTLPSSLLVLHTPQYSTPALLSRTLDRLSPTSDPSVVVTVEPSLSLMEFAAHEGLALALAKEFLEMLEKEGGVLRDDQSGTEEGGTRWYRDIISSYPLTDLVR